MAKRRRAKTRTIVRRVSAPKRRRSSGSSKDNTMQIILGAAVYGGVREKLSNVLTPITSKVPFGDIADELVLGTIHYFGMKKVKNKMLKSVFKAGLIVEAARLGEAVADGSIMGSPTVASSSNGIF